MSIWSNAWPKNIADKLSRWFSVMLVPKLLLTPIKIRIFGPKTAKFGPKSAFLVILGQILPFFAHFVQCWPKNNVNKVPRWVFRYVGDKTFDFSSIKKFQFFNKLGIFTIHSNIFYSSILLDIINVYLLIGIGVKSGLTGVSKPTVWPEI